MKKVIIGIITKHLDNKKQRPNTFVRDELKDAIYQNGAIPIGILPPSTKVDFVTNENEQEKFKNINKILCEKEK